MLILKFDQNIIFLKHVDQVVINTTRAMVKSPNNFETSK